MKPVSPGPSLLSAVVKQRLDGNCSLHGLITLDPLKFTYGFYLLVNNITRLLKTLLKNCIFEAFETLLEAENSPSATEMGLVRANPPSLVDKAIKSRIRGWLTSKCWDEF